MYHDYNKKIINDAIRKLNYRIINELINNNNDNNNNDNIDNNNNNNNNNINLPCLSPSIKEAIVRSSQTTHAHSLIH